jgi:recombination protein RecR
MLFDKFPLLQKFIDLSRSIPYVPSKHTYRLVEFLLHTDEEKIYAFVTELISLKKKIVLCETCHCWKERESTCPWCSAERNQEILCVVETWIDAVSLEKANMFDGVYHILGGSLSPLEGITYDKLTIDSLMQRIHRLKFKEIIIATNQTPEGEATAYHIERMIKKTGKDIIISSLPTGIPVGTSLAYVDRVTLAKALHFRRKI